MKKLTLLLITLAALISLQGCNTVRGFGKDVQAAGHAIEHAGQK